MGNVASNTRSDEAVILDPEKVRFEHIGTGVLSMKMKGGRVYKRVYPICAFPVTDPNRLVSIRDVDNKEIGMLNDLMDLSPEQEALIRRELHMRYLVPRIREIRKIENEYGIFRWEVDTDRGEKVFYVKGRSQNIIFREEKKTRLLITDIDECRYEIPDYTRLARKCFAELEKVL